MPAQRQKHHNKSRCKQQQVPPPHRGNARAARRIRGCRRHAKKTKQRRRHQKAPLTTCSSAAASSHRKNLNADKSSDDFPCRHSRSKFSSRSSCSRMRMPAIISGHFGCLAALAHEAPRARRLLARDDDIGVIGKRRVGRAQVRVQRIGRRHRKADRAACRGPASSQARADAATPVIGQSAARHLSRAGHTRCPHRQKTVDTRDYALRIRFRR
jgi:hypothetical protein